MNPNQPDSSSTLASRFRLPSLVRHSLLALLFVNAANAASLAIATKTLPASISGTPYSQTLAATGGTSPYKWTIQSGGLPPGLALDATTGIISGTPSTASSWVYSYPFSFYLKVTDSRNATAFASLTLLENAPTSGTPPPPPPTATQFTLTVVKGSGGGSFAANASVAISANAAPAGKVFQNWTGATVANAQSPNTSLTMPAANTTVTANYVAAPVQPPAASPLAITATTLPAATVGIPYAKTLAATGGTSPYKWALVSGAFPGGLSIDAAGNIAGTPTNDGSWIYGYPFQVYISVTDSVSATAASSYVITVLPGAGGSSGGGSPGGGSNPPPATTHTVTVTSGTANGVASGSFAPGATITLTAGAAPAGQWFKQWSGNAPVANSFGSTTTFTMPSSNVTETASFYAPAPIPQPVATHPRLWLTPADLPKLQSWASASNPVYAQGLVPLLNQCITDYNIHFFPGGVQNSVNPDLGDTQGYQGLITEQYALIFAFHSLIDPSPANRILHAQRARNLLMVAMNEAAKGALSGAPFRDPLFSVYNRANATSEAWPLVVDWIYSAVDASQQPILTAADKATIRTVFLRWANECLNASTTGGDHPSPVGMMNSTALLGGGSGNAYRMASNNYYLGHARLVTLMSLAFDPADDLALNPATPDAILGNTLRSYIANATGAWLYQEFAMLGDPAVVRTALNLPANASVGLASGGLPPEGMLYGHSYAYIFGQLLALKTAGFADPAISGPQVALANNPPVWDRFVKGMTTSLVPAAQVFASDAYLGPVYQMASYGDILRLWITPDFVQPFALLAMLDQQNGDSSRLNAERWFAVNAVEGGAANLISRLQNPWSYGVQDALLASRPLKNPHFLSPT